MRKFGLWHRIQHWFGWNKGIVETWFDDRKRLMVGFRCVCGELQGVHESVIDQQNCTVQKGAQSDEAV